MADDKDKKIGEVPHLENVTGDEKIPVSANGQPRYVEVKQIREGLQPEGNYLTQGVADKRYAGVNDIPDVSGFVTETEVDEKLAKLPVGGVTWGRIMKKPSTFHIRGSFEEGTPSDERYVWVNGTQHFLDENFDFKLDEEIEYARRFEFGLEGFIGKSLKTLTLLDGVIATNFRFCFLECKQLIDISGLYEAIKDIEITNVMQLFNQCESLEEINLPGLNTKKCEDFNTIVGRAWAVKYINFGNWDTSNGLDFGNIFYNCPELITVNIANWDFSKSKNIYYSAFSLLPKLENIIGPIKGLTYSIDIHDSPLTADSAMVLINGLKDGVTGQKLTLKSTTYSQLTPDQLAIGTAKGWSVASQK